MTNHARFEQSPAQELAENNSRADYLAQRGVLVRSVSYSQAVNAAAIARMYPTMNPSLAGPVMIQGIPYDSPAIADIAMMDQRQIDEDGWIASGINFLQAGTRGLFVGLELGTAAIQQIGNTVVGMMQGRPLDEAFAASGSSILGEMLQQQRLHPDRPINLGSGWLPESEMPWETEGFSDRFRENFAEIGDQTPQMLEEAFQLTVAEALEEYGAPITQRARTEQFSTPLHKTTRDGRTYTSNFSPINAAMNPIVGLQNPMTGNVMLEPDDAVYQTISKWGQLVTDVTLDPWNIALAGIPKVVQARRFMPVQMHADDLALAGTRAKRHWYNSGNGPDWLTRDPKGKQFVEYLTGNTSYNETMRVLDLGDAEFLDDVTGKVVSPGKVYGDITDADNVEDVTNLLMPHMGKQITEAPRAHLGPSPSRPLQTVRTALSRSYKGPGGYTTRMDSVIAKPFIRWGAKMTRGVFDGNDIAHSLHVANNWMRTINVPSEQIDEVLRLIGKTDGTSFEMATAGKKLKEHVSTTLQELHGANKADVEVLWGKWDDMNDQVKAFHTDNMAWQVRGIGTRMKKGPDLVEKVPDVRPFTPAEIAPEGRMPTSDLIGARKKAGGVSDRQIRVGVGGVKEQSLGGSRYVLTHGKKSWEVLKVGNKWELTRIGVKRVTASTHKTKKAAKAAVLDLLDEEMRGLSNLGSSVADEGVQEAVKVEFNPKSGQYRVADGNKRVLAAEAAGIEDLPVEIIEKPNRFVGQSKEAAALRRNTLKSKGLSQGTKQVRSAGPDLPAVDPMLSAEYAGDLYILPDQRELRRMTSKLRKLRNKLGRVDPENVVPEGQIPHFFAKIPKHQQSALGMYTDIGMARWREWQLIALRWTFNVIPDELFRLSASGFASPAFHPGQYLMWTFGGRGNLSLTGDKFADIIAASDMGAGYAQNLTEVAQFGYIGDIRRVPWVPYKFGDQGYYDAWATKVIHQWADPFSRKSLTMTREDAFKFFTSPEGAPYVDEVVAGSRAETRLSKLKSDPEVLKDHIAEIDARAHQHAGGTWRAKDVDPHHQQNPGTWTDSNGNVVSEPPKWNGKDNWIITQSGDPNLMDIMTTGRVPTGGNFVDSAGNVSPATRAVLYKGGEPGRVARPKALATERATRRQGLKQVDRLKSELKKSVKKWKDSEADGIVSPAAPHQVRGQDPRLAKRMDSQYKGFVDNTFAVLGQAPSMILARSPFFRQVYWQEMARAYVNATPDLRKTIRAQAKKTNVVEFDGWIKDELKLAGYVDLPTIPKGTAWDELGELDDWARAVGLDKTKSLLYDLSESHNIVDMTRNIFVFAEAWWEIISRWSNMLFNPKTRSFYNWEKARQIGEFAQQEGWMSENEFGQTVFNWPSLGLSMLGQQGIGDQGPTRLGTEITVGQMISNPLAQLGSGEAGAIRSVVAPGASPIIQILAPPFQKMLPTEWQQMFQYTVTGEFPLAQSMLEQGFNSLPSSFKNAATLIDADLGITERRFNNNVAVALETLTTSGVYNPEDPGAMKILEKDALRLGTTLTVARLIDSFFSPESPRYVPQLLEDSIRFDQQHYINAAAIGAALEFAETLFNDPKAAAAYIGDQYGLDPFNLMGVDIPNSRVIKQRPVTSTAYTAMLDNAKFYEDFEFTAYAFWPDDPDEDFYQRAWNDQLNRETTVAMTLEEKVAVFSARQASLKYDWSSTFAEQQSIIQGKQNPERRPAIEQEWRDWLFARRMDIEGQHPGWSRSVFSIDAHFQPGPATPEFGDLYDDFKDMVVRDQNGAIVGVKPYVMQADPIVAEFVRGMMLALDQGSADSVARGNQPNSWLSSTAAWAVAWQTSLAEQAQTYVEKVRIEGESTIGIEWIVRRWLDPVLKGVDMGTPFITDSALATAPTYRADDRITTP